MQLAVCNLHEHLFTCVIKPIDVDKLYNTNQIPKYNYDNYYFLGYTIQGVSSSKLVGHTSISAEHDTFGMTVMWQNGRSVTSWTGQCHICNGEETLMTTWIMTSKVETCEENWKANR